MLGEKLFNKIRGKGIAIHSQARIFFTLLLPRPLPQNPNPNAAPVTHPQVKTVRDNPVEPIKMLKITVEGLEKDDL